MKLLLSVSGVLCLAMGSHAQAQGRRPAPPPSRYAFTVKFDTKSLPKGVTLRPVGSVANGQNVRFFISNASDIPLVINQRFQNDKLVTGNKLVSGKVLHYFPNGVPMAGKQHLKGWQAPFGEIKETLLVLKEPPEIYKGRKPGLDKTLPPPAPYSVPATLDDKPIELKGTVHYELNKEYDKHYQAKGEKR